jgi:glycosyltransferase involved in cell wall biosynthesis
MKMNATGRHDHNVHSDAAAKARGATASLTHVNDESITRIAVVVSHPIPHFAPWHRKVAALPGIELKVFYCVDWGSASYFDREFGTEVKWDIGLLEGYASEFLPQSKELKALGFFQVDNPSIRKSLEGFMPDVVQVFGYAHRTMWRAVHWCNQKGIPVLLYSDSSAAAPRSLWKRAAKAIVVKNFYRGVDGALFTGDNNRLYHAHFGLPEDRLFHGSLPIDKERLTLSVGDPVAARLEIRRRYGIPVDAFVALFSGKLSARKSPIKLLSAIGRCAQRGANIYGLFVGEGAERTEMERLLSMNNVRNVVLAGFVNQSAIGKYYAASDALVVPSAQDPHPLVLPEAGCFGLPVIASDRLGCIGKADSARNDENTLVYPYSDIAALAECILRLYRDKDLYSSMSVAAIRIAALQDIPVAALQMKNAAVKLKKMGCRKS